MKRTAATLLLVSSMMVTNGTAHADGSNCYVGVDKQVHCVAVSPAGPPSVGGATHVSSAAPSPLSVEYQDYAADFSNPAFPKGFVPVPDQAVIDTWNSCPAGSLGVWVRLLVLTDIAPDHIWITVVGTPTYGCYGPSNPVPPPPAINPQDLQVQASNMAPAPSVTFTPPNGGLLGAAVTLNDATSYHEIDPTAVSAPCFAAAAAVPIQGILHMTDLANGATYELPYTVGTGAITIPAFQKPLDHRGVFAMWIEVVWTGRFVVGCGGAPATPAPLGNAGSSLGTFSRVSPVVNYPVYEVRSLLQ